MQRLHPHINVSVQQGTSEQIKLCELSEGTYLCYMSMRSDTALGGTAFAKLGDAYEMPMLTMGSSTRWQWSGMAVLSGKVLLLTIVAEADINISLTPDLWIIRLA